VEDGVYDTTDEHERLVLHRAALEHWRGGAGVPAVASRVARHAEATNDATAAAAAFVTLGTAALREHRMLDADQALSGALRHLEARDATRARALMGRARARHRMQRMQEAL